MPAESAGSELRCSVSISSEQHPNETDCGAREVSSISQPASKTATTRGHSSTSTSTRGSEADSVECSVEEKQQVDTSSSSSSSGGLILEGSSSKPSVAVIVAPASAPAPEARLELAMSIGERVPQPQPPRRPQVKLAAEALPVASCGPEVATATPQTNNNNNNHHMAAPNNCGAHQQSSTSAQQAATNAQQQQQQQVAASEACQQQRRPLAAGSSNWCAGCREPIRDKFIFSVIDLHWHQDCVQCSVCAGKLDERCYTLNGKLYCKQDYWRRFGPKCFACREPIERSELVQRINRGGNRVYHLKCFTCTDCRKQLRAGEMFHLLEGARGLLCKDDYNSGSSSLLLSSSNKPVSGGGSGGGGSGGAPTTTATATTTTTTTTTNQQTGGQQDKPCNGQSFSGGSFESQHQIFYTLTSSSGGCSSSKRAASKMAGLSGGEEEPLGEDAEASEEEDDEEDDDDDREGEEMDQEEQEFEGLRVAALEDSDAADGSLDGMRRLLAGYHTAARQPNLSHENDENHGGHCFRGQQQQQQQQQLEQHQHHAKRARQTTNRQQLSSTGAGSNTRRKRRRKRGAPQHTQEAHKKLSRVAGESILHGITGAPNNNNSSSSTTTGSILAATALPNHHHSTSTTGLNNHLAASSQQQQKCSSFSSPASTASNCSINSSSSVHNQQQAAAAHLASAGQHHGSASGGSSQQQQQPAHHKPTRVRTVLNERQLQTLRDVYASNPRPDALLKEQLVDMTGLSPRVIRVWFQNKRCKDKKKSILYKQMQQHEKEGRHLAGLSMARGLPMVASSPIQYDDQSSVSSTPASGAPLQPAPAGEPASGACNPLARATDQSPQQQQPVDIHAYQPPWKSLVEYAHQHTGVAAPTSGAEPTTNRLDASSPRYQQLMGKIHGYMGDLSDQTESLAQHHLRQHLRLPEQVAPPPATNYQQQPPMHQNQQQQQQQLHHNHLSSLTSQHQHQLLHHLAPQQQQPPPGPPSTAQAPLMNHLHQF